MLKKTFPDWHVFLIILLEGFVTVSLEILVIRQLMAFVGNSVIVTSLIIGVFLLCLAYGYRAGGRQKQPLLVYLRRNFFISAIGIGFGLSYFFIACFFSVGSGILHIPLIWTLLIYLCLIVAPIVYFLGQTVPISMHLLDAEQSAGKLGGKVLHLSTIGSFLGSVLTALVLMSFLGVAWTIIINVLLLAFLILMISERCAYIMTGLLLLFLLSLVYIVNRGVERTLFVETTAYANYRVLPDVHIPDLGLTGTVLSINNSYSSFVNSQKQAFPYIEYIKNILFNQLKLRDKNILILGSGGFSLSAANTYGNHFTYVDIEPKIEAIVQAHFLREINGRFVAADARQYVAQHPDAYDVIVSDTYSNRQVIPAQLLTIEYFNHLKTALKPGGIAVFNVIGPGLLNNTFSQRVDNTIRHAFGHCTVTPLQYSETGLSNLIYVCQNDSENDQGIYTDDLNRASFDIFNNTAESSNDATHS